MSAGAPSVFARSGDGPPPDPFGSGRMAAATDVIVIAAGTGALMLPVLAGFIFLGVRGSNPLPLLGLGIAVALAIPWVLVSRLGTPSEAARARASLPRHPDVVGILHAPLVRRSAAALIDACVLCAGVVTVSTLMLADLFTLSVFLPFVLIPTVTAIALVTALLVRNRRPFAAHPTAGLAVCGLRRVSVDGAPRTVMASALPPGIARPTTPARLVGAWVATVLSSTAVILIVIGLTQAVVDAGL